MARAKGSKQTGGRGFQKGHDPRRNTTGGPKVDVRVREIKSEIKVALIEVMKEYFDLPAGKAKELALDPNLSLGKRTALRFWVEASNRGDPARLSFLARIVGLEVPQKIEIETPPDGLKNELIDALSDQLAQLKAIANVDPGLE